MNEDQLIQHYFSQPTRGSNIAVGIGDDAAVLDVPDGYQLVISTDTLLEGRHFLNDFPADKIATLPSNDETWLNSFSNSLHTHLTKYQTQLVGGDTVKGELSITL